MRSLLEEENSARHVHSIAPKPEERPDDDFYRTPEWATRKFLAAEPFEGPIWEPACGDGAMSKVLAERHQVHSSNLTDRGYGQTGIDFLLFGGLIAPPMRTMNVVTNPPFTLITEFVEVALRVAERKVAIVARTLWLEGVERNAWFDATGLTRVWVHSERVNISRDGADYGDDGKGGMISYSWFVWDKADPRRSPRLRDLGFL